MTDKATHTPLPCPFCNGQANTEIRHSRIDGVKDRHFPSCLNGDCPAFIVEPYVTYSTKREALTAWNTRAVNSHHDLIEALREAEAAIAEYYRYWTGGETRGSYDGKPERQGLWNARYKARAILTKEAGR